MLFDELQMEVARDLLREPIDARPRLRGRRRTSPPRCRSPRRSIARRRTSRRTSTRWASALDLDEHAAITPVFLEGDERLQRHEFLLWLGDGSAYALVQRRGRGATWGFHTSDPMVVEGLVSKLQAEYDLQPY